MSKSNKRVTLPEFIQMEAAECGAASLKIMLEHFGTKISINTSKKAIGIGRDGSSARDIMRAAQQFGLTFKPKMVDMNDIKNKLKPPYILFWDGCHWLTVEGFVDGYFYVSDPAQGNVRFREKDLENNLHGLVLLPQEFDKSKIIDEGLTPNKNIFNFIKSYNSPIIFSGLLAFISIIPETAFALTIGVFTEQVATGNFGTGIYKQSFLLAFLTGIFTLFLFFKYRFLNLISNNMIFRLCRIQVSKLISAPLLYFAVRSLGELGSRVSGTTNLVRAITNALIPGFYSAFRSLIILVILFSIEWRLAFFVTLVYLVSSYFVYIYAKESQRDTAITDIYESEAFGVLFDIVNSSELVKSTGSEISFFQNWATQYSLFIEASQGVLIANANIATVIQVSTFIISTGVLFASAGFIMLGSIDLATYTAFLYMSAIVIESLSSLPGSVGSYTGLIGSKYRLNDTFDLDVDDHSYFAKTEFEDQIKKPEINPLNSKYKSSSVYLDELTFYYPGAKQPTFENVKHEFKKGSFTSIVGPSGCGKSTLAKLICNLIPSSLGKIILQNKEYKTLPPEIAHSVISYVPQDAFIFKGTLYDNITLFDKQITEKDVEKAIKITDLLRILKVDLGLKDYDIEDNGSNLSAGQKQIIEITRALVRNPKVLILDEATACIDVNLEKFILGRLKDSDLTIISIAHRKTALDFSTDILDLKPFVPSSR